MTTLEYQPSGPTASADDIVRIVEKNKGRLNKTAYRYNIPRDLFEDFMQDTYLSTLTQQARGRLRQQGLTNYVQKVFETRCKKYWEHIKYRNSMLGRQVAFKSRDSEKKREQLYETEPDARRLSASRTPLEELEVDEEGERVRAVINRVAAKHPEFYRRYFEGKNEKEIAKRSGVTRQAISLRMAMAKEDLARLLRPSA